MPQGDRIYTEADVAEMRDRWERASKEQQWTTQLALLTGQIQAMPDLIRAISREVAVDVVNKILTGQHEASDRRFGIRWDRWAVSLQLFVITIGLAYSIFIRHP